MFVVMQDMQSIVYLPEAVLFVDGTCPQKFMSLPPAQTSLLS